MVSRDLQRQVDSRPRRSSTFVMEYGAHLPLISFSGEKRSLKELRAFADTARGSGYTFLCANDHLVFSRPWLDGPAALAAVLECTGDMRVATTIALPIVRGPAPVAKWAAAIDFLSNGRLVIGVGPGSSARDHSLAGVAYEERAARLEECIHTMRAFFRGTDYRGIYYDTCGERLEPRPVQSSGPPIWIGSWGARGGLRRTATLADGWLASGYNTDPGRFAKSWSRLREALATVGKDAASFPNAIATMWTYVSGDRKKTKHMMEDVLAPMLKRPVEQLRELLPIGTAEECADRLRPYRLAGAQRILLWPLADEIEQLEIFQEKVASLIAQD